MLDYMHIGASRTGTTWLFKNFVQRHPSLDTPNGKKAPAFWNQQTHAEYNRIRGHKNWQASLRPLSWYKDLYKNAERPGIKLADLTDGNAWQPKERVQEIYKHYPDVKITYAIRNPITTIWSHVVKHDKRVSPTAPMSQIQDALTNPTHVYNTHYMENIERWLDVFPENQTMIYFYTEIKSPLPLLQKLSNHVGVDPTVWNTVDPNILSSRVNAGSRDVGIPPAVLSFLVDYHGDRIAKMEKFFNRDLSHWLEGKE